MGECRWIQTAQLTLEEPEGALSPDLKQRAEEELQEKEEWRQRDIAALRELVADDPDLTSRTDDDFLLRFLRARKFDYDRSFEMLRRYYWIRHSNRPLLANLRPAAVSHVFSQHLQMVLPGRDTSGCRVFVFRPGAWDPTTCSMDDIFCANVLCLEHVVREQATQVCGVVAIQDFTGFGLTQARHLSTEHIRRMISVLQDSFPLRFKGFHFVFEPKLFYWVFAAVRPFLSRKIANRLFFHGSNLKSLHACFDRAILPEELGGTAGRYHSGALEQQLTQHDQYFTENNRYGFLSDASPAGAGERRHSSRAHFYPGTFCMQTGDE